jgi:hypothetical protein
MRIPFESVSGPPSSQLGCCAAIANAAVPVASIGDQIERPTERVIYTMYVILRLAVRSLHRWQDHCFGLRD